jgi:circadian clock protein KaiC
MPTQTSADQAQASRISTGITGLDEILEGGLVPGRSYLVRGGPGCGKTTLGLHFLTCGSGQGEPVLFISLAETEAQLRDNAERFGFDLNGVSFLDLSPDAEVFSEGQSYDIFSAAEVERGPVTNKIVEQVEHVKPKRVFIDSVTQLRYLATDPFQFRKQTLSFLRFLAGREATVLLTSEGTPEAPDDDLRFISDGVIELESRSDGRSISVSKFRGSDFRSGSHTLRIGAWGLSVFPHLRPETHVRERKQEVIASGVPELDQMLHGGLERGTVTIITGPTGVGKTTLGLVFMKEAAGRGERSVVYTFEESPDTLFSRCEGINIPVRAMVERGTLVVVNVEPLQYTPDEFAQMVRFKVEEVHCRIVMIDSISGYSLSLRGEDPVRYLHAISKYASNMGVTTLLVNEVENITGNFRATDIGISYLADNVIFLRYLDIDGELHKGIGVLKKRLSDFEKFVRRLEITRYGVKVGEPFGIRGVLSGTTAGAIADQK